MHKVMLAFLFFISTSVMAGELYPFEKNYDRLRFQQLTQEFRCLVCQNQDLATSDAALALDLRSEIYTMMKSGSSDEAIVHYMLKRYGDFVLFKPPVLRSTLFLWLAPLLLALVGWIVLSKMALKPNRGLS